MKKITVIATATANPGKAAELLPLLQALIEPSKKDEGFIQYDLHRDLLNPEVFVFYEQWQSQALLDQHLASPHLTAFVEQSKPFLKSLDVRLLEKLD